MGFFTGSSACYCCGNKYWIRKYDPTSTLPVLAQVDITPVPTTEEWPYAIYAQQLIARGDKVTSLWLAGSKDRFARHSSDLAHEQNIEVTHAVNRVGSKWWDTNGSALVVIVDGSARYYNSNGSLVYTFTPTGTEKLTNVAIDSAGNMYSTVVSETTFPPVTNRFLYKHNSLSMIQWKNSTNLNAEGWLAVAADDYVWIYRPSVTLLERRNGFGALNSAVIQLGASGQILSALPDSSSGIWAIDSDISTGSARTRHVTSSLVVDRGWWAPGVIGTGAVNSSGWPNILAFDGTTAAYARVIDVYPATGAVESIQKLDSFGNAQWARLRTSTPSYWGSSTFSGFAASTDVKAIAYANGALYAAGGRTS